jgi:hypothetical protein
LRGSSILIKPCSQTNRIRKFEAEPLQLAKGFAAQSLAGQVSRDAAAQADGKGTQSELVH